MYAYNLLIGNHVCGPFNEKKDQAQEWLVQVSLKNYFQYEVKYTFLVKCE